MDVSHEHADEHGHLLKVPVCQRADYTILYENWRGLIFGHVEFVRFNKTIFRDYLEDTYRLQEMLGSSIYIISDPADRKHQRFLRISGFTHAGHGHAVDGSPVFVFKRTLNGQTIRRRNH